MANEATMASRSACGRHGTTTHYPPHTLLLPKYHEWPHHRCDSKRARYYEGLLQLMPCTLAYLSERHSNLCDEVGYNKWTQDRYMGDMLRIMSPYIHILLPGDRMPDTAYMDIGSPIEGEPSMFYAPNKLWDPRPCRLPKVRYKRGLRVHRLTKTSDGAGYDSPLYMSSGFRIPEEEVGRNGIWPKEKERWYY
jgi:hypothetical protein